MHKWYECQETEDSSPGYPEVEIWKRYKTFGKDNCLMTVYSRPLAKEICEFLNFKQKELEDQNNV